jgi:endonuclease/exonuclease/phosphatase family metal-dependent hydrolase
MSRILTAIGSTVVVFLLAATAFFFWASSGRLPEEELAQTRQYAPAPDTTAPDTLTATTYNVGYLSGMTNNEPVVRSDSLFSANLEAALTLLREIDPDLAGFQEIDFGAARSGYVQQLDTMATQLGYPVAAQAVNWDERYLPFPYGRPAVHFGRTLSGQAVLSRHPIRQHGHRVLPRPPQLFLRDVFYLDRLAQTALLDLGGRPLVLINVHLEAYHTDTRETQARILADLHDRLTAQNLPVLLLGDFNSRLPASDDEPADETMQILLEETELRPVYAPRSTRDGGVPATYPADNPTRKIDHILYPPAILEPIDRSVRCGAPAPPSDHCAVTGTFTLSDSAKRTPTRRKLPRLDRLLSE